jgi:hypothetical protein
MGYTAIESPRPTPGTQRLGTDAALELAGAILAATGEEWGWDPFVRRFG